MKENYKYDLSVLVITYCPDLNKLMRTLLSVLYQKDVDLQIIVADDGSKENYFDKIEELFREKGFSDYVLVANPENKGITQNFYSGLIKAEGEFLKGISPGDYLYSEDTLKKWLCFMRKNQFDVSFGKAVYFHFDDNEQITVLSKNQSRPRLRYLFDAKKYNSDKVKQDVWVNGDNILGAAYFAKTELVQKYCEPLLGKVKYMEDVLYRIMLLDDIHTVSYPVNVMMYEFGTGVSTTQNSKWKKIIADEKKTITKMLSESGRNDPFSKKLVAFLLQNQGSKIHRLGVMLRFYPNSVFWLIKRYIAVICGKSYTDTVYDQKFMEKIRE